MHKNKQQKTAKRCLFCFFSPLFFYRRFCVVSSPAVVLPREFKLVVSCCVCCDAGVVTQKKKERERVSEATVSGMLHNTVPSVPGAVNGRGQMADKGKLCVCVF